MKSSEMESRVLLVQLTSIKMIKEYYVQLLLKDKGAEIAENDECLLAKAKREETKLRKNSEAKEKQSSYELKIT